jgi:hypothetical protein
MAENGTNVTLDGTNVALDVSQKADKEKHITCPSAHRFGGQTLPNIATYFPI